MTGSDVISETSTDHEQLEEELLAQDADAERASIADIDDQTAHHIVAALVDDDVVEPIPDRRTLVHEPSGKSFDSIVQLAIFHSGWTAALDGEL